MKPCFDAISDEPVQMDCVEGQSCIATSIDWGFERQHSINTAVCLNAPGFAPEQGDAR